jgi:hypothetical protein
VATWSREQVLGRLIAGITGSNPAEGMDVCVLCLYMLRFPVQVEASATGLSLVQRSPTVCLIVYVIKKPQCRGRQGSNVGCSVIVKML